MRSVILCKITFYTLAWLFLCFSVVARSAPAADTKYKLLVPPRQQEQEKGKELNQQVADAAAAQQFCGRLAGALAAHTAVASDSKLTAKTMASSLIASWRAGSVREYVNLGASQTAPAILQRERLLSVSALLKAALQTATEPLLLTNLDELKFTPHMQSGSQILVMTNQASVLNLERAVAVINAATKLNVRINVMWSGTVAGTPGHSAQAELEGKMLAYIAAMTQGQYIVLADVATQSDCSISP